MPQNKEILSDERAQEAAYLLVQFHMSQKEIGERLGRLSQSQVSRLLKRAEDKGWLKIERCFITEGIPEERLNKIRHLLEPEELISTLQKVESKSGVRVRNVRVFDSVSNSLTDESLSIPMKRFGRAAAGRLAELLRDARIVGVSWGKTVGHLVEGLTSSNISIKEEKLQFIPLCAELISSNTSRFSSTRLADRMSEVVNGKIENQLSLSGVRAYVPRHYKKEKVDVIWEFICESESYRKIFKEPLPIVEHLDSFLTSVGSTEGPFLGKSNTELQELGNIEADDLKKLVVGDIGGVLLPKSDLGKGERSIVDELNNMWTGVKLEQIKHIAQISSSSINRPGNIVVAFGNNKANILFECIRIGLVNELIIDKDLAESIKILVSAHSSKTGQ